MNNVFITCGDINGIGPEIAIKAIDQIKNKLESRIIFFCPSNIFEEQYKKISARFAYKINKHIAPDLDNLLVQVITPGKTKPVYSTPTAVSGDIAIQAIMYSLNNMDTRKDLLVTAPISKEAVKLAGYDFPGHTELLADFDRNNDYGMMFLSPKMKTLLVTIHEPIKKVPELISKNNLQKTFDLAYKTLKHDFRIKDPKIAVLGLNPHSGENGKIGDEELRTITPVINKNSGKGFSGPYVPDAYFGNKLFKNFDLTIGMYHDQLLIPFKLLNFEKGVNFTAGLSFVRTSPDHGTAYNLAGKNIASPVSMIEAIKWGNKILKMRN